MNTTFRQKSSVRMVDDGKSEENTRRRVLISYRTGSEVFAESLAHRIGEGGFLPWYDKWEILAGDSIPREIGEGFKDVYAVIIILTADYPSDRWAREELEMAITKRVVQNIRVIPVLYEKCEIPELLKSIRYVDCTDDRDEQYEAQFQEIINGLNKIDLNPYR